MTERKTGLGFTTEAVVLAKVMRCIAGAVERRNTIPVLANVLIEGKDGRVTLTGTDLELTIVADLPASDVQDGALTVSACAILAVARGLDATDVVRIEACDAGVRIVSGHYSAELFAIDADEFPRLKDIDGGYPHSFVINGQRLRTMLDRVEHAISTEETRYYLNGVLIEVSGEIGELRMVATDGHRLSLVKACDSAVTVDFPRTILPRKAVKELRRLLRRYSGDVTVAATGCPGEPEIPPGLGDQRGRNHVPTPSYIRFELAGVTVTSKPIDGKYPDYERVIPKESGNILSVQRETIKKALGRVTAITEGLRHPIKFVADPGRVTVSTALADLGSSKILLNGTTKYVGDSIEIGFQARYLIDALALAGEDLEIRFEDSAAPVTIRAAADDSALEVVMPMRV